MLKAADRVGGGTVRGRNVLSHQRRWDRMGADRRGDDEEAW